MSQNPIPHSYTIRLARAADVPPLCELIFEHGVNAWNYLPRDPITQHLQDIAVGSAHAILAEHAGEILGFVSYVVGHSMGQYQPRGRETELHGIIHEAVVRGELTGRGIGSQLLSAACERLAALGCEEVYVCRHDENPGSHGMMRKAGFVVIDVYDDFTRRTTGNRRTAVSRKVLVTERESSRVRE